MKIVKKILILNRRLIRSVQFYFYFFGCVAVIAVGLAIESQQPITVPVPEAAQWTGGVLIYGSLVLAICNTVDHLAPAVFAAWKGASYLVQKWSHKQNSITARVRQEELSE